ncbi:atp-dependent dna helicase [Stylonychia lemnae]|uniref:DNA 3'-5' helicase n=1 Tax=Stylonychia lemnae TaxID=5949 RepID=A0A078A9N3_STYLE|nr:atp-dependent dna helicase [Stylonychia lemnae]|eukprot:CDW78889.1 atp-dependent dna helicase [Stylonychia lemnae]
MEPNFKRISHHKEIEQQEDNDKVKLNKEQLEAINHYNSPLLILAGVGTGKTQTLMSKYSHLLKQGISPQNILAITFTKKAAKEMKLRAQELSGKPLDYSWVGTFHAQSARMLRRDKIFKLVGLKQDFKILEQSESRDYIVRLFRGQKNLKRLFLTYFQEALKEKKSYKKPTMNYSEIQMTLDNLKERCIEIEDDMPNNLTKLEQLVFMNIYEDYQKLLKKENSVDFRDLLFYMYQIFRKFPDILVKNRQQFKYILVDEVQDLNTLQQQWLKLIVGENQNLTCVGDDDQMIYSFRGATGDFILNFEKHFPTAKIIKLEQNYRSTKNILMCANNLIRHNKNRKGKVLWTDKEMGTGINIIREFNTIDEEVIGICNQISKRIQTEEIDLNQIAILSRMNNQARRFENQLILQDIPYQLSSTKKPFLQKFEVKKAHQYLLYLVRPNEDENMIEVLLTLQKIGQITVDKLIEEAKNQNASIHSICEKLTGVIQVLDEEETSNQPQDQSKKKNKNKRGNSTTLENLEQEIRQEYDNNRSIRKSNQEILKKIDPTKIKKQINGGKIKQLKQLLEKRLLFLQDYDEEQMYHNFLKNTKFFDYLKLELSQVGNVEELHRRMIESLEKKKVEDNIPKIKVMTIHASKGLEFDIVYLPFWVQGSVPIHRDGTELEEERRLAFVGITRAKNEVVISMHNEEQFNDRSWYKSKSQFLREMS